MSVDIPGRDGRLELGLPHQLFRAGVSAAYFEEYDVAGDGQRFLVLRSVEGSEWSLKVTLNWTSLLD